MELLINIEPWWRFGAALLIGAMIGIEREFVQQRNESASFAGIRTFALISLFGSLAAYAAQLHGIEIFYLAYGGFFLLIAGNRVASVNQGLTTGMTTEVVAVLTPLLGALVIWDHAEVAAALGVITALMLAMKPRLHRIARKMSNEELRATLQFGLLSLVILPLLPDQPLGPFGVLNPFRIWLLVILVSGISFLGYLLMKFGTAASGTGLAGLFGGLVSSTATTVSFAGRSKEAPQIGTLAANAIILASAISFPRIIVEVLVVHSPLLRLLALPLGAMLITGGGIAYAIWRNQPSDREEPIDGGVEVSNPLRLQSALTFGALFTVVLILVRYANEFFGRAGLYIASGLSGLTGVDSITLSASGLAADAQLTLEAAALAILAATLVNMLFKLALASALGSAQMRRIVTPAFLLIIAVGGLATWGSLALFT
ncbi:MAG: MgtC/SapB family protein [Anaerolineales bacterium]